MELVTKRFSLKEILPDYAKQIAKEYGGKEEELEYIVKGFTPSDMKFVDGENASIDYITTKDIDRDGEIVDPDGAVLDMFKKHPVVVWCHDYKQLPIGKSAWIKSDANGLISKTIYATKSNPFAKQVYQYRKDGFPLGKSIGFVPLSFEDFNPKINKGLKRKYNKWIMLEYSDVPIPSNAGAMQIAVSKGLVRTDQMKELIYFSDIENTDILELEEEGNMTKKAVDPIFCDTCKSDQTFEKSEDGDELVCKKCGGAKKKVVKDIEEEDIEQKGMVVCPECGEKFNVSDKLKSGAKCPKCGIMVNSKGEEVEVEDEEDEEDIKKKAKKLTCPDCGAAVATIEGKDEVACPECGTMLGGKKTEFKKEEPKKKEEKKEIEEEKIEQKRFVDGNPSVSDIMSAISSAISRSWPTTDPLTVTQDSYGYVLDLFPINYPSGKAVVSKYDSMTKRSISYLVDYRYKDEIALISNPSEVLDAYVKKTIKELLTDAKEEDINTEELDTVKKQFEDLTEDYEFLTEKVKIYAEEIENLKAVEEELAVIKEGRVLSGKNRIMIKDCISQMNASIEVLDSLMNATDISTKDIDTEEIEEKEFLDVEETIEDDVLKSFSKDDIEEIVKKTITSIGPIADRIDMSSIMNNVEAKLKGRVLLPYKLFRKH
jgi:DNA-directed RNA polymerase subunit RPC12/RpoP